MKPSEVRENLLADQASLSEKLTLLEAAARAVKEGNDGEVVRLRLRARDVCQALFVHLATQSEILLPVLRELDAGGEARVKQVKDVHRAQRSAIVDMRHKADHAESWTLAEAALVFARSLRDEMARQGRDTLSPDLLRDPDGSSGKQ